MSRYLIDQLATRPNIDVGFHNELVAAHGDDSLETIDIHNTATGETTRLESAGLFIFIGADAETGWLPSEIALDRRGFVLTGSDVAAAGAWPLDRDPYLLETSVPRHLRLRRRSIRASQAGRRRCRRGQHGDRHRPPVPQRADENGRGGTDASRLAPDL
jgi:hypothetical protein